MFTAYFDDSGTDSNSDIAVAACYVSSQRGWDEFVDEWDVVRAVEEFDCFHMSDFMAPTSQGKQPWCDWDNAKKERVYTRLAQIINSNKRIGIAVAVPKTPWDEVPNWIRAHYGYQHYTFAVRVCINTIRKWRDSSMITLPVRYTFDWEMQRSRKRKEIQKIFDLLTAPQNEASGRVLIGVEPSGYSFDHKEISKPLQASDILAWQMRSYMRKVWHLSNDDPSLCHPGFRLLRENQEMSLGFFTQRNIDRFVSDHEAYRNQGIEFPVLYERE